MADRTAMHMRGQIATPLQLDRNAEALRPAWWQALCDLFDQGVCGIALRRIQAWRGYLNLQFGVRCRCDRCGQPQPPAPAARTHWARMD